MVATQEHRSGGWGGGEGGRDTVQCYQNGIRKYLASLASTVPLERACFMACVIHQKRNHALSHLFDRLDQYIFCGITSHAGKEFKRRLNHCLIELQLHVYAFRSHNDSIMIFRSYTPCIYKLYQF